MVGYLEGIGSKRGRVAVRGIDFDAQPGHSGLSKTRKRLSVGDRDADAGRSREARPEASEEDLEQGLVSHDPEARVAKC